MLGNNLDERGAEIPAIGGGLLRNFTDREGNAGSFRRTGGLEFRAGCGGRDNLAVGQESLDANRKAVEGEDRASSQATLGNGGDGVLAGSVRIDDDKFNFPRMGRVVEGLALIETDLGLPPEQGSE